MRKKLNHTVFAEGESTGHAHRASGGTLYRDDEVIGTDGPMTIFENDVDQTLTHEEHHAHIIPVSPTGRWRIGGVIEIDPFKDAARRVID